MNAHLKRLQAAMSPVAVVLALLALVVSSVGAGYAAATIGAKDIKKNAVTSAKIKKNAVTTKKIKNNAVTGAKIADGSVTNADLAPEAKATVPALSTGGEGDCAWASLDPILPTISLGAPAFRKDRSGRVHLSGLAGGFSGAGGDGTCDPSDPGQASDGVAFVLPAGYAPLKTILRTGELLGTPTGLTVIVGASGLSSGSLVLPPGAVYADEGIVDLTGLSFDAADAGLANGRTQARGQGPLADRAAVAAVRGALED